MEDVLTLFAKIDPTGFVKGSQKLIGAVRSLNNRVAQIGRNTERMASQMANPLKRLLPTIVGVGSAYGIISKAVSAFMAQNEQLSAKMSSVWTALGNLLGPLITQIIDWVTTAISYFLSFMKLLGVTGKSASQLSQKAGKSAGELKKTLAGFDELNILNDNSGSGAGGAGLEDVDPSEWMKKLSELLKNKLWDEAADLIIEKMNSIINTVKEKAYDLGEAIGEYVGGALHVLARIVNEVDWSGIGASIALFLNGLLKSINDIDPTAIGALLVAKFTIPFRVLTGFLENISGPELAETFNGIIVGAFNSLTAAIEDADFVTIGNNIREFFDNINWDDIRDAIEGFLEAAWNAAWDLFLGFLGKGTDNEAPVVKDLEALKTSLDGLVESLKGLAEDLWEHRWKPMFEFLSEWVLPTALEGLKNVIDDIKTAIDNLLTVRDAFREFFSDIGRKIDEFDSKHANTNVKQYITEWDEMGNEILVATDKVTEAGDKTKGASDEVSSGVTDLKGSVDEVKTSATELGEMLGKVEEKATPTAHSLTSVKDSAKEIGNAAENIEKAAESIEKVATKSTEASEKTKQASEDVNKTSEEWEKMGTSVEKTLTEMDDNVKKHYESIMDLIKETTEEIQTTVQNALEELHEQTESELISMSESIQSILEDVASSAYWWGEDLMSNFIDGIYSMMGELESACSEVASTVESYIGFSEPDKGPLSNFHTYAPDMMELYASGIEKNQSKVVSAVSSVASGISDAFTIGNGMNGISLPMSAVASGSFLPYNVGTQASAFGASGEDGFITKLSGAIYDAVVAAMSDMQGVSGQRTTIFEVNGREFFRATYDDQQAVARERGISLINR